MENLVCPDWQKLRIFLLAEKFGADLDFVHILGKGAGARGSDGGERGKQL